MTSKIFKSILLSVLLLCSLIMSCPFSVSASELVPDEDDDGVIYHYDDEGNVYSTDYLYDPFVSPFALTKPHYPNFDDDWLGQIPWDSFPSYIRAIAYSTFYNVNYQDLDYHRVPFIVVSLDGSTITIRAGWDVSLWYREETGACTIGFSKDTLSYPFTPKLYMCKLKYPTFDVVSDWTEKSYGEWGNSGYMYNYSGSGFNTESVLDVYTYGCNGIYKGSFNYNIINVKLNSDGEQVSTTLTAPSFAGMAYKGFVSTFYNAASNIYFDTFVPNSHESGTGIIEAFDFGLNTSILQSGNFIPLENLPYGNNSGVLGFQVNNKNTYQFILDSSAESYVFRNPAYSDSNLGKVNVSIVSSSPIYRIGYTPSGSLASVGGATGLTKCENNFSSGSTSFHQTIQYFVDHGYYVYTYNLPEGFIKNTVSRNFQNLYIEDIGRYLSSYGYGTYPGLDSLDQFILQEQNSILDEQNSLIGEGNEELSGIHGELTQSGDSDFSTTLPDDALSDYNEAESELLDDYDPDDLEDDLDIEMDESALTVIWDIFDKFVKADNQVFALILSCLGIGIISLILGR